MGRLRRLLEEIRMKGEFCLLAGDLNKLVGDGALGVPGNNQEAPKGPAGHQGLGSGERPGQGGSAGRAFYTERPCKWRSFLPGFLGGGKKALSICQDLGY